MTKDLRFLFPNAEPSLQTRRPLWKSALALAALPLALALAACGKLSGSQAGAGGAGATPPPEVAVITVQAQTQPVELEYTGQTAGSRETEVRARVGGILNKRLFEEGAVVQAGTPLYQIDPATYQNQLTSAEANVAVAEARAAQTRREYARLAPLAAEKAISQKEYDDSKSALESAEASLKQSQAQASEARLNLGYTKVLAPIGGSTGVSAKSEGSLLTQADSLLTTIVQTNPMYVNFSVSEGDMLHMTKQLKAGQLSVPGKKAGNGSLGFAVQLKLSDGSTYPRAGKLNFASERINAQTGSFDVRAEIPNPDGALRPGQFVRVSLGGASRPNALSVPQRAIIDSPFGKIVFVVNKDDKLEPHPVELDGWTQGQWIVTKGLKDGDRVLVDGYIKAHDPGMLVKPVPFVPAAPAGTPAGTPGQAPAATAAPAASAAAAPAAAK
jgi:membrane fusion protein (multidrug efflux system)